MFLIIALSIISAFSAATLFACLKAAGLAERKFESMHTCVQDKGV